MRVRPDHHPEPGKRDPGRSATQSGPPAQLRFPPNSREQPPSGQRAPLLPAEARPPALVSSAAPASRLRSLHANAPNRRPVASNWNVVSRAH